MHNNFYFWFNSSIEAARRKIQEKQDERQASIIKVKEKPFGLVSIILYSFSVNVKKKRIVLLKKRDCWLCFGCKNIIFKCMIS